MKTILKYPLPQHPGEPFTMPPGARILTVQQGSNGRPYLWALVEVDAIETPTDRAIAVFGTGSPIDGDPGHYVGTFQEGSLAWHVFDRTPREPKKKEAAQ